MVAIDPAELEKGVGERQNVVHLKHKVISGTFILWTASNLTFIGSRRGRGDANTGCLKSYWARLEGEI